MESSSQDSQTTTKWTCPACHSDYSSNSNKRRHLQHCSFLKERMEEGMPADEIERLIEGFLDEITTKTERCTCEAGYTFCHNIISDINWDAELFVVTGTYQPRAKEVCSVFFLLFLFPLLSSWRWQWRLPATSNRNPRRLIFIPMTFYYLGI
jgi:hypothetical protein